MRPAARSSTAPMRFAHEVPVVAFVSEHGRVAAWSSRALLAGGVVFAAVRTAPDAGPIALAGRLARETLHLGPPSGAASLGWLGACAMALVSSFGSVAVLSVSAACALATFALVEFRSRTAAFAPPAGLAASIPPVAVAASFRSVGRNAYVAPAAHRIRRATPHTGLLSLFAAPLAALCALDAFAPGGGSGSWLGWAFVLILLDRPSPLKLAGLAATTVLWCNLEPEGLLAPLAAIAVAAGATLDAANRSTRSGTGTGAGSATATSAALESEPAGADTSPLFRRWLAALIAVSAACLTPAGFGFAPAALVALHLGNAARGIVASSPAVIAPHAYPAGLAVAIAFALAAGLRARGMREALPVIVAFVLALANGAFLPIFGIAAAPAIVAGLRKTARERSLPARLAPPFAVPPFAVPAFALPAFAVPAVAVPAFALPAFAVPALLAPVFAALATTAIVFSASATARDDGPILLARREAAAHARRGVLFCAKAAWCDVALAAGERVVVDGRLAPYDATALDEQRTIVALGPDWRGNLVKSGATAVLAGTDSALATLLGLSSTWRVAGREGQAILYERLGR